MLVGAVIAAALSGGACGTSRPVSWAGRFIVPGTPAVDVSAATGDFEPSTAPPVTESPPVAEPPNVAPATVSAATLEESSPLLRARLSALAAAPTPEAHLDVAAAYAAYQVHDRAFDYLAAGLVRYPRHADLHDAVARLWRDWGLPDLALRHAHLAVHYAPDSAGAHTTLGSVLWALDVREGAARAFERAFVLAPSAPYARRNWCTAATTLGRPRPVACDRPDAASTPQGSTEP